MSVNALKLYSQQANGVTYSDPLDPDFIVRFKTTSAQKILDGQKTTNYITEITANDNFAVAIGSNNVVDSLSVRIRVSGSLQSMERLTQILKDLTSKVETWSEENVLIGFAPSTAPINTVA